MGRGKGREEVGRGLSVKVLVNRAQIKMFEHLRIKGSHEDL